MSKSKYDLTDISNSLIVQVIDEYVRNEEYRPILKDRFTNGLTIKALADKYGFSEQHTKRIVMKYGDKILLIASKIK